MDVLFVTNKPNYCHKKFAESLKARFYYIRHYFPDGVKTLSLPVNGWINSLLLPGADVYFAESIIDYYPIYYKNPQGKKIILIAEDTLFKLDKMSGFKRKFLLKMFNHADGFITISDLCKQMLLKYTKKSCRVAYPFPHENFSDIKADITTKSIMFIGREDLTKGYLKLVEAVRLLRKTDGDWKLYLVGSCGERVNKEPGIIPLGFVKNMKPYLEKSSILVHPADFDPCPATIFEAMQAGIIPIISNNIGQTKLFNDLGLDFLILKNTESQTIATKIMDVYKRDKVKISRKVKEISSKFIEEKRIKMFKKEFSLLLNDLGV